MPAFPNIAGKGFRRVAFYTHVPSGFAFIKEYWARLGKCVKETTLWHYASYRRDGKAHTMVVNVKPADKGCANMRILLRPGTPKQNDVQREPRHRITEPEFLRLFRALATRSPKERPLLVSFDFTRVMELGRPAFSRQGKEFSVREVTLVGSETNPIHQLRASELKEPGQLTIDIVAKPVYRIDSELTDDRFFLKPLHDMERLSEVAASKIGERVHAESFGKLRP